MKVDIFASPTRIRYLASSRFSFAYLYSLLCTTITIILPILLITSSPQHSHKDTTIITSPSTTLSASTTQYIRGMWLKQNVYREQPQVKFDYKLIMMVNAKDTDQGFPKELFYSTIPSLNKLRLSSTNNNTTISSSLTRMAAVKSREVDHDRDALMDKLVLNVDLPLKATEQVYGVQTLVFVTYRLQNHVQMNMESMAYVHHNSALPGIKYKTHGDLVFKQESPLGVLSPQGQGGTTSTLYDEEEEALMNEPFISNIARESNFDHLLEKYYSRSFVTEYVERVPLWTRDPLNLDALPTYDPIHQKNDTISNQMNQSRRRSFNMNINVNIPRMQEIIYVPTLKEVLLDAWMRYLSTLVIIIYLFNRLNSFVYTNQVVKCHQVK